MSAGQRVRDITKPTKCLGVPCQRCCGKGVYHTYGTCFRCGGYGQDPTEREWGFPADWTDQQIEEWQAKRLARLEANRLRRATKAQAERDRIWNENVARFPQIEGIHKAYWEGLVTRKYIPEWGLPEDESAYQVVRLMPEFCCDILEKARKFPISEKQVAAMESALAQTLERVDLQAALAAEDEGRDFLAPVGDKIDQRMVVKVATAVDTQYGLSRLVVFEAADGGEAKTFGTAAWLWDLEPGDTVQIRGTVKVHDTYNGMKQTVLTRTKGEIIETLIPAMTA